MASKGDAADNPVGMFVVLQGLQAVADQDQPRRKQAHRKSKQGCVECRRRRVKCDEKEPCTNCVRRKEQCLRPSARETNFGRSLSSPRLETDPDPQVNLWHLELFHHFAQETVATLSFPDVWPKLLQQSFHDECIMWAILCTATCHLYTLTPQDPRYVGTSLQFLPKSLYLFRQNLSRPFTKENSDSLMGCSILMNYISWTNLDFLDGPNGDASEGLDLSRDQLFLLSPGVRHVYTQAMPVFMAEQSVFLSVAFQHPRLNIEAALARHGEDPNRYFEPLLRCWDSPRFQEQCRTEQPGGATPAARSSWLLFNELDFEKAWGRIVKLLSMQVTAAATGGTKPAPTTPPCTTTTISSSSSFTTDSRPGTPASAFVQPFLKKIAADSNPRSRWQCPFKMPRGGPGPESLDQQMLAAERQGYELVARCLSPILCCISSTAADPFVSLDGPADREQQKLGSSGDMCAVPNQVDFRRLFFTIPVLCSGPFLQTMFRGDSRALLLLFHFYRAARILLSTKESWWAHERSRVMEGLVLKELRNRGFTACLRPRDNE